MEPAAGVFALMNYLDCCIYKRTARIYIITNKKNQFDLLTCNKLKYVCRDERHMNYFTLLEAAIIFTVSDAHPCSVHQHLCLTVLELSSSFTETKDFPEII